MIITIKISKKPLFIIVTNFGTGVTYHYWMDVKPHVNPCDVGMWNITYK